MPPLIVTAAIIRHQGKVLITQRPAGGRHAGWWEFPGGKLEEGESPREALQRELQEELDLEAQVGDIFEVAFFRYDWGPVLILAYECRPTSLAIQNLEVVAHAFVHPAELPNYQILPADQPIIDRLMRTT